MKIWPMCLLSVLTLGSSGGAQTQDSSQHSEGGAAKLFPKGWVRGFIDFGVAPPHNEPDVNRCVSLAASSGGPNAPCAAFARYMTTGTVELQPFGTRPFRPLFVFWEPRFYFGRNVPQVQYTFSASPIAAEQTLGFGIELRRNFEVRLAHHRVNWFGHYQNNLGTGDLGANGPLGLYTTVSVRWKFGGWSGRQQ